MGVHSLWSLLEPVGRRVNIEAISNKRLAVGEPTLTGQGVRQASMGLIGARGRMFGSPSPSACGLRTSLSPPPQRRQTPWIPGTSSRPASPCTPSTLPLAPASYYRYYAPHSLPAVSCADASIWLFQFMRAMRDERGDMVKNAHLRGFFSRICRQGGQEGAGGGYDRCGGQEGGKQKGKVCVTPDSSPPKC